MEIPIHGNTVLYWDGALVFDTKSISCHYIDYLNIEKLF